MEIRLIYEVHPQTNTTIHHRHLGKNDKNRAFQPRLHWNISIRRETNYTKRMIGSEVSQPKHPRASRKDGVECM